MYTSRHVSATRQPCVALARCACDTDPPSCTQACVPSAPRWNVVGVQGSLLSIFVEPIYFSSIILGSLYHGDHLSRAMYQRIANIEDLPPLYALNKPLLSGKYLSSGVVSLFR